MQLLTITRRSGEKIPINPSQVCYVRTTGVMTTIYMTNGEAIRVAVPADEITDAIEHALGADVGARKHVEALEEQPMPPEGLPPAPGAPGAPEPAPAAEDEPTEEELAEAQGRAQRRQEAEADGHHNKGGKK